MSLTHVSHIGYTVPIWDEIFYPVNQFIHHDYLNKYTNKFKIMYQVVYEEEEPSASSGWLETPNKIHYLFVS